MATCFAAAKAVVDRLGVGIGIGIWARPIDRDIAGRLRPQLRRAVTQCIARVGDRREFLVFRVDELGGVLRRGEGLRDHHRHRFADMHDAVERERRPVRHDECGAVASGDGRVAADTADTVEILAGQHPDHAGRLGGRLDVDAHDLGEGVRRADEIGIGLVRQRRIGDVTAVAAHQRVVFDAAFERRVLVGL